MKWSYRHDYSDEKFQETYGLTLRVLMSASISLFFRKMPNCEFFGRKRCTFASHLSGESQEKNSIFFCWFFNFIAACMVMKWSYRHDYSDEKFQETYGLTLRVLMSASISLFFRKMPKIVNFLVENVALLPLTYLARVLIQKTLKFFDLTKSGNDPSERWKTLPKKLYKKRIFRLGH